MAGGLAVEPFHGLAVRSKLGCWLGFYCKYFLELCNFILKTWKMRIMKQQPQIEDASVESAMLGGHFSTVAQSGQTIRWLWRGAFATLRNLRATVVSPTWPLGATKSYTLNIWIMLLEHVWTADDEGHLKLSARVVDRHQWRCSFFSFLLFFLF